MHKKIIFFLLLVILINSVNASKEGNWIVDQSKDGSWGNVRETAFSILALKKETGYNDLILNGSKNLIDRLENCMITNNCNVKDTAIAVWALNDAGGNAIIVNKAGTWLLNSRKMIFTGELPSTNNEWKVQIVSSVSGNCILSNTETGNSVIVPVDISKGYVPWFEITSNILTTTTESLNLDCSSLGTDVVLSLINKKIIDGVENYFIKQEEHSQKNISVSFGIPCWSQSYRTGDCEKETTAYVLYVLGKIGKTGDRSWLTSQSNLGLIENAFLYKLTNNEAYLTKLATEKNTAGYWGIPNEAYTTAMIYNLLKPSALTNNVGNWIASRRNNEGCWTKPVCNVEQSAIVVYSGAYDSVAVKCPDLDGDGICDDEDNDIDGDGLINSIDPYPRDPDHNKNGVPDGNDDLDEDDVANKFDNDIDGDGVANDVDTAPWDPTRGKEEKPIGGGTIVLGGVCTTKEGCKGEYNAAKDCVDISNDGCPKSDTKTSGGTGEEIEETIIPSTTSTTTPTEEESSVLLWSLLVLLLLISLIGGGYLAYKKGLLKLDFIKKEPKPEAKYTPRLGPIKKPESYSPRIAKRSPGVVREIGRELDQSMKDLERLLGKK